jgi:hypothetical protein
MMCFDIILKLNNPFLDLGLLFEVRLYEFIDWNRATAIFIDFLEYLLGDCSIDGSIGLLIQESDNLIESDSSILVQIDAREFTL